MRALGLAIATVLTLALSAVAAAQEAPQATADPAPASVEAIAPALIDIPSIGTHAVIVPLGLEDDGSMASPSDPDTVGWYAPGPGVGTAGNVLLDGHVDWGGRLRVFGLLKLLEPGDTIQITDTNGNVLTYSVVWKQLVDADDAPVEDIFAQGPQQELTLITCGGAFDPSIHMYVSRWVVRAVRDLSQD